MATINFRTTNKLKKQLEEIADKHGLTLTDVLEKVAQEEVNYQNMPESERKNQIEYLMQSFDNLSCDIMNRLYLLKKFIK